MFLLSGFYFRSWGGALGIWASFVWGLAVGMLEVTQISISITAKLHKRARARRGIPGFRFVESSGL